ncbi:MAG: hypothetical protein K2X03_20645 [Bryobacteraceae bacterium]|nr:hypothetical protein [Bryobacteraceae bacterium]
MLKNVLILVASAACALAQSQVRYGSYLGTDLFDTVVASAVDSRGNIWLTGYTSSDTFPVAGDAYRNTSGGGREIFLARIDPRRTGDEALTYATYIGGDGADEPTALAVDGDFVYVCGVTASSNFPLAGAAFQGVRGGDRDAFVLKLDPRVGGDSGLVYSTYLGGSRADGCNSLTVRNGLVYAAGYTNSETFPTSANAFQAAQVGNWDAWVAVLDMNRGSAPDTLVYSTRLGGELADAATAVTADAQGLIYVAGYTASAGFPVSPNAPQRAFRGVSDLFLVRINPAQSATIYSTLWGGSDNDVPTAIALDATGAAVVAGYSLSSDFPTTSGSAQASAAGRGDAFVMRVRLDPAVAEPILYSTLLGGSGGDVAQSVAVNAQNEVYVVGYTLSTDFPLRGESFQRSSGGVFDGFVARILPNAPVGTALSYTTYLGGAGQDTLASVTLTSACEITVSGFTSSPAGLAISGSAYQTGIKGFGDGWLQQINLCPRP